MSKKVEVNSPYFMPIHAAQNSVPEGVRALILPLPTPAGVVLRSGTVTVTYIYHILTDMFITLFILQHFLFLSSENLKQKRKGNIFHNGRVADW